MSKILFVDDDLSLLNIFEEYFSDEFSILITDNEKSAIQILDEKEVAIVVVDLHLGKNNGFNLLNFIKIKYPLINRIMLTGDLKLSNIKKAINEIKVAKYYTKPISFETLRDDFTDLLHQYRNNKLENNQVIQNNIDNIHLKNFIYTRNSMLLEILVKYKNSSTHNVMGDIKNILLEKLREIKINLHIFKDNGEGNLLLIENQLEELLIFSIELECHLLYFYLLVIKIIIKLYSNHETIALQIYRDIQNNQQLTSLTDPIALTLSKLTSSLIESHISSNVKINLNSNLLEILRINYTNLLNNNDNNNLLINKADFETKFFYILIIKNHKTLFQRTIKASGQTNPHLIGNFVIAINEFIREILLSEGSLHTIDHDAGTIMVHKVSDELYYVGVAQYDNIKTRVVLKEFANLTHKYLTELNGIELFDAPTESLLNNELDKLLEK